MTATNSKTAIRYAHRKTGKSVNPVVKVWLILVATMAMSGESAGQIRFDSVDQVLNDLRTDPDVEFRLQGNWLVAEARYTTWTFTVENHPAHPAVVERRVFEEDGSIRIETRSICTAAKATCSMLYRELTAGGEPGTAVKGEESDNRHLLEQPGLTISLEDQSKWAVTRRSAVMIVLRQDGPSTGDSIVGAVQLERLPELNTDGEFLNFVAAQRTETLGNDPRVSSPEFDERLVEWNGQTCVQIRYRYEDVGAVQQDGSTSRMKFANNGIRCRHPDDLTIGVRIGYSARYNGQLDTSSFESEALAFIDSISLKPFGTSK